MSMTLSGDGSITGLVAGGLPDASVVDADLSLAANSAPIKTALNASGSAPIYACRAWVKFDGFSGAVAILASGNVSSITDGGVGKYTVNFTTAMEDANYSVTGIAAYSGGGFNDPMAIGQDNSTSSSASSYPFYTYRIGVGIADSLPCCLAIFR